jgi:hypothetical protein
MREISVELIRRFAPLSSRTGHGDFLYFVPGKPQRWHEIEVVVGPPGDRHGTGNAVIPKGTERSPKPGDGWSRSRKVGFGNLSKPL